METVLLAVLNTICSLVRHLLPSSDYHDYSTRQLNPIRAAAVFTRRNRLFRYRYLRSVAALTAGMAAFRSGKLQPFDAITICAVYRRGFYRWGRYQLAALTTDIAALHGLAAGIRQRLHCDVRRLLRSHFDVGHDEKRREGTPYPGPFRPPGPLQKLVVVVRNNR
jgi:hypothetical protein